MAAVSVSIGVIVFTLAGVDASRSCHKEQDTMSEGSGSGILSVLWPDRSESSGSDNQDVSQSLQDWVPAVSLEAEQAKLPHQLLEHEFRSQFQEVIGTKDMDLFEKDLKNIMQDLASMFTSLPKNEYGDVGHTAVRYALHRLFVARHGWYIQGIEPNGTGFSSSSPADVLRGQIPDHAQRVVEKLLYGRGFGLYEISVLAAVLESLIHREALSKATVVFEILGMSILDKHPAEEVDLAIDLYMAAYIMGLDVTVMNEKERQELMARISNDYHGWESTRLWVRSIRQFHSTGELSFQDTLSVLIDMGERYGKWQQTECMSMKQKLIDLENEKNGCVPVAAFYRDMLTQGKWEFSEAPDYLRQIGALDESDPRDVKVMIPNYVVSASNRIASSRYYSVACLNECEEILGRIEQHVQAPDALPEELARLVSMLPSSSLPSNRTLPGSLLGHLDQIAAVHDGRVPLHSRLFMQWMHNAYPHECAYPPTPGKTPGAWSGSIALRSEIRSFLTDASAEATDPALANQHAECGKWLNYEELYVPPARHPNLEVANTRITNAWSISAMIAFLGASASMLFIALHMYKWSMYL